MPLYAYTATDLDTSVATGTVVADSPRAARDQLRERGLSVHELAAHAAGAAAPQRGRSLRSVLLRRRRVNQSQVIGFVREMSTLLSVGMPLLEAIDTAARQQSRSMRPVLLTLRERVAAGGSLADAMREQPQVFDAVTVHMVEVGQDAGTLDTVLAELASFKERGAQLKGRLTTALLYPAIVFVTGIGVSLFLMTYVVPGLLDSLIDQGRDLPWITQGVKSISDLLLARWWLLLGAVLGAAALFTTALRTELGRRLWDGGLLKLPGLGELIRKQAIVRIAFVIATLMKSGIAFEKAVAIAHRSTRNVILRRALDQCRQAVEAGRDIAVALEKTGAFPPTVVQVFALGQQSGRLEEMLERLAIDYDRQVTVAAARLTAILEPMLILMLAVLVGAIAFAVILPILEVGHVL